MTFAIQLRAEQIRNAEWKTAAPSALVSTDGWVIRSRAADVNANLIPSAMPIALVPTSVARTRAARAEPTPIVISA